MCPICNVKDDTLPFKCKSREHSLCRPDPLCLLCLLEMGTHSEKAVLYYDGLVHLLHT